MNVDLKLLQSNEEFHYHNKPIRANIVRQSVRNLGGTLRNFCAAYEVSEVVMEHRAIQFLQRLSQWTPERTRMN